MATASVVRAPTAPNLTSPGYVVVNLDTITISPDPILPDTPKKPLGAKTSAAPATASRLASADAATRTANEALQVSWAGTALSVRPRRDQQPLLSPSRSPSS